MLIASYAALQGWDGLLQFDYALDPPGTKRMHPFDLNTRPDNEALYQAAALVFRQGYVRESEAEVAIPVDDAVALSPASKSGFLPAHPWLPYAVRVSKQYLAKGPAGEPQLGAAAELFDATKKQVRSSTGQLFLDYARGILRIDAPQVQGFVGDVTEERASRASVVVDARNPWSALVLVSMDQKPIAESGRVLLVAVGRAENTEQVWRGTRHALKQPGRAPVLMQGVKASISLEVGDAGARTVSPLDQDGRPRAPLPVQREGDRVRFSISPSDQTTFYLVER
jgi:hypothetical protein